MNVLIRGTVCALTIMALCSSGANATIVTKALYTFDDVGATTGGVGSDPTYDSGPNGLHLERGGSPTYAPASPSPLGGSHSMSLSNTFGAWPHAAQNFYTADGGGYLIESNNWGADFWLNVNSLPSSGDAEVSYVHIGGKGGGLSGNYDDAPGLIFETTRGSDGQHRFTLTTLNGWHWVGNHVVTTNEWMHVAYVNDGGTGRFFVDGVEVTTHSTLGQGMPVPGPTTIGSFGGDHRIPNRITLGALYYPAAAGSGGGGGKGDGDGDGDGDTGGDTGGDIGIDLPDGIDFAAIASVLDDHYFRGADASIDNLRIFTFDQGQFNIQDIMVPEPATPALLLLGGLGLLSRSLRRRNGRQTG